MAIKVVLDKKGQTFIRGLRRRIRTDVPKQAKGMALVLESNIQKQVRGLLNKNPTGALEKSFEAQVRTSPSGNITATVGSELPYALIHETGGRAGRNLSVFIRPTSYLTRAIEKAAPELQRLTTKTLATIVRTSAR